MSNLVGKELGQYQILEELGRGGMAVVYKAYQPSLDRHVAIKVLPQQFTFDEEFVERFLREARAVAQLNHPHIVTIHDVGEIDGTYFIVMEYVEGPSLSELLRQHGALSQGQTLNIVSQIASALDYAHQRGFVHRDVKPNNVLLGAEGEAKLMDFGIVRAQEGTRLTQTGTLLGTPEYMSPEQARGLEIDHRSDIYSLGVVVYEMLMGQAPFHGDTMAVLHAHVYEPPDLSVLPAGISAAISPALAKEPGQRYESAGALAAALEGSPARTAGGSRGFEPPTRVVARPGVVQPQLPRMPVWVWVISGLVLLLLLSGCLIIIGNTLPQIWVDDQSSSMPQTSVAAAPTSTPLIIIATVTPALVQTQTTPTTRPASPTPDIRIQAREVVEGFQEARAIAYSTWDTGRYYDVLFGGALESSLQTIEELSDRNCRYYISLDREMTFRYEDISHNRVVVIVSRDETQRRVCSASTSYTCYVFEGRYVVERIGDYWYITAKSVQNLIETSPCP